MFIFVDPATDQEWHIDDINAVDILPVGCVLLTPEQVAVRRASPIETLYAAKMRLIDTLSASCEAEIVSGFFSSALGGPHIYQSDRDDQLNLVGAVATAAAMPYKCQDGAGAWDYRLHTAAQLAQVLADGAAKKLAHLQRYTVLKMRIETATTIAEAEAVVW